MPSDAAPLMPETIRSSNPAFHDEYYQNTRPELLNVVPATALRILDVGCGMGALGASIKARQRAEVHGIELSADAAQIARSRIDKVWVGMVEQTLDDLAEQYYDCIILADVLEHLVDPWSTLTMLTSKLQPTGTIIVSVPNIQHWGILSQVLQGRWDYQPDGILDRTHLRFFTRKSVSELFWSAGLRITSKIDKCDGPPPPRIILDSLRQSCLNEKPLTENGQVFQFLTVGEIPAEMPEPKIAVVVLNWNGKSDTLACLDSLQASAYGNMQLIVVDNASTDGSVAAIHEKFPDIVLIETGANLGFSGGNNVGIQWALDHGADYVLLLNNDTVASPSMLSEFAKSARIVPNAVLGAKIYYYDQPDVLWFAGARWLADRLQFEHIGLGQKDGPAFQNYAQCDYITGCALFASADTFRKVGLLDDQFFLTYEETDWCYRAQQAGYPCVVVPGAKLWHKVSASFGGVESPLQLYFYARNLPLFAERHLPRSTYWRIMGRTFRDIFQFQSKNLFSWRGMRQAYWSLRDAMHRIGPNGSPATRGKYLGLRDYLLRRFGNCPAEVRTLGKRA